MIYETDFQKTVEDAFLLYGASVAQERSIMDVRDCLKDGLRKGLYAQFTNGLTHKDKFQKAQKSVAAAMAQSYTHGDSSMYGTFMRSAKPWIYRYPIEDVQGSVGDPCAPDNHSAARYVEMKSGPLADYFFNGLKKDAIDEWYNNYDDTELIPSVFPSIGFWNIVNGCNGIAVAMATSVPQFNLKEVNNALIKIIKNPEVNFDEIYCAPDFAQGGTILNGDEVKESIKNGNGKSIRLRANLEFFPEQNMIQATRMPFGVFTNTVIGQLKELTENDENYGIEKVIDHTKKEADIRIYLKKGANPRRMIKKLYHDTSLEDFFVVNMIMLENGRFPKVFGWREACDAYIEHIRNCRRRIVKYEKDKAEARLNIVNGLMVAVDNINNIIRVIKSSKDSNEAANELKSKYGFNDEQVVAILAMKLSSLTRLDADKLKNESTELTETIKKLTIELTTPSVLDDELIKILKEVATKFGDNRRTQVINSLSELDADDVVTEEQVAVLLFDNNSLRIVKADEMIGAKKGKKGVNIKPPKGATLINTIYMSNLGAIACFSDEGRMYSFNIDEMAYNCDYSIYDIIKLQDANEKIVKIIDSSEFHTFKNVIFVTKTGMIKKTETAEYALKSRNGVPALKLKDNDAIISVLLSNNDDDDVIIAASNGNYVRFKSNEVNPIGRNGMGVRGINLKDDAEVASASIIYKNIDYKYVFTVSAHGKGKLTDINEFSVTSRGCKGALAHKLSTNEKLSVIYPLDVTASFFNVFANNKQVTLKVKEVPISSRVTTGVKIIKVDDSFNKIEIKT